MVISATMRPLRGITQHFSRQFRLLYADEQPILNFASHDALNLIRCRAVRERGIESMSRWGMGSLPSRELPMLNQRQKNIEAMFASMTAFTSATLLDGAQLQWENVLQAFLTPNSLVLKHASIPYAPVRPSLIKNFEEIDSLDPKQIIKLLSHQCCDHLLILVESISSTTGKATDLRKVIKIAQQLKAYLIVDDSNAFTTRGKYGLGIAAHMPGIDLVFGSIPKTYGTYAAYFLTSPMWKDAICLRSPAIAAALRLSPLLLGMIEATLELLPSLESERQTLEQNAKRLRSLFLRSGTVFPPSHAHILSLPFDSPMEVKQFQSYLSENQCIAKIEPGERTCRLIVNARHTMRDLQRITQIVRQFRTAPYCEAL